MWTTVIFSLQLLALVYGQVTWLCDNFPADDPLQGCNWGVNSITWGSENLKTVDDPAGGTHPVAQIKYPKGSLVGTADQGGVRFNSVPFPVSNEYLLSYDIYFSPNFDFVKGGKLPGLYGGARGNCVGGSQDELCFSFRFHWRKEGDGEIYAYIPHETESWFCDFEHVKCNFQYGHSLGRGSFRFVKGQWQNIAQHIVLNDPGKKNGVLKIYYNGNKVFELGGLQFRVQETPAIDTLLFSTFFGGNDETWASTDDVYIYVKNFRIEHA